MIRGLLEQSESRARVGFGAVSLLDLGKGSGEGMSKHLGKGVGRRLSWSLSLDGSYKKAGDAEWSSGPTEQILNRDTIGCAINLDDKTMQFSIIRGGVLAAESKRATP